MIHNAGIAALIPLLAITVAACGVSDATLTGMNEQDVPVPLPIEASTPHRADIFATYHTTGTLESDADAPVLARVSGEVVEILVEEGSVVEKGQILALLDGERLRLEMLRSKARLEKTKREYERLVDLQKRGLVSTAMYEGLKFDLQALEASYKLKRLDYGYTRIRAPIAGVISSREIKVGGQVRVNDPIFRITDNSRLVAHLKIPQTELTKFSAGLAMRLHIDATPEIMFAATIARISPTIDMRNGTFRATAYVDNDGGALAPGMFARFSVAYEKRPDALLIPAAALIEEDNVSVVYVVSDGTVARRVIQTGVRSGGLIEILDGLNIAELIVTSPQAGLRNGSRVLVSDIESDRISG